ncbi:MAG: class I SAM-dependent methyltransferase [Gemmatimonadales bacterium]|nr:class I SAM-dependent methyltransferase [Gemmatimonadales bacterium]
MTEKWYQTAFGPHYPILYGHRNEEEASSCLDLLPKLAPLAGDEDSGLGRILDLGCGQGRHLARLAYGPIPVVGLDLSAALLKLAVCQMEGGKCAPLVRGDMLALPFLDNSFSAVLSLFTAFGYCGNLAQNRPVVEQIAQVLKQGGHWYLDYLNADRVRQELGGKGSHNRSRSAGPLAVTETRVLSPDADRVIKTVVVESRPGCASEALAAGIPSEGLSYQEQVALFTVQDLDQLAGELGLERVAEAGNYKGDPLGQGERWILVYRRVRNLTVRTVPKVEVSDVL